MPGSDLAPGRTYGGLTSDERAERRREQLLEAGLERFAADGWASTTVHDVCRTAGLSQRYFYEAFASREELLVALLERIDTDVRAVMDAAASTPGRTPDQRVHDVLEALAAALAADPRQVQVAFVESCATPAFRAHRTQLLDAFADRSAVLMRALHPSADEAGLRRSARLLAGGVAELLMGALAGGAAPDRDAVLTHLAALVRAAAHLEIPLEKT